MNQEAPQNIPNHRDSNYNGTSTPEATRNATLNLVLPKWCKIIFSTDRIWLYLLALVTLLMVIKAVVTTPTYVFQWIGILLSLIMIPCGIIGNYWLLQYNPKGVPFARVALMLSIPVQLLRLFIMQITTVTAVHPASIFAQHPEYATLVSAVWFVGYDLLYLLALLNTQKLLALRNK